MANLPNASASTTPTSSLAPNAFVRLTSDNRVTVMAKHTIPDPKIREDYDDPEGCTCLGSHDPTPNPSAGKALALIALLRLVARRIRPGTVR